MRSLAIPVLALLASVCGSGRGETFAPPPASSAAPMIGDRAKVLILDKAEK